MSPPPDDSEGDTEHYDEEPAADSSNFADQPSYKILAAPDEATVSGEVERAAARKTAKMPNRKAIEIDATVCDDVDSEDIMTM